MAPKNELHLPAEQVGKRRWPAAIRHMHQVDAGHHFEQLAGYMRRASVAG